MTQCGHELNRACDRCPQEHIDALFDSLGTETSPLAQVMSAGSVG